jgi:hypothetical protein
MRALAVIALVLVALPAHADEDKLEVQRMRFIERGEQLTATGNLAKLFDQAAYEQLSSGFPSTIQIGTFVYPRGKADPIAAAVEIRTVVYDLWDEQYVIKIEGQGGKRMRKVKYRAEALKILTALDDFPIARLSDIPYDDIFYLGITVQLNPVSKETLAEVRRWISQGTGGGLDRGGVFFGSFVSVFVNPKIADADRVLRIRSQPFYRPKP